MKGEDRPPGACYDRRRHGKALIATEPALNCWTPGTHHEMCCSAIRADNNLSLELEVSFYLCHTLNCMQSAFALRKWVSRRDVHSPISLEKITALHASSSGLLTSVRGAALFWESSPHGLHYCMLYPIRCPSHRDRWVVDARLSLSRKSLEMHASCRHGRLDDRRPQLPSDNSSASQRSGLDISCQCSYPTEVNA